NANRYWQLAAISDKGGYGYTVKRADRSSMVIEGRDQDYGFAGGFFKLFFDAGAKRLLKKIDFEPIEAMKSIDRDEARRVGLDPVLFDQIKNTGSSPTRRASIPCFSTKSKTSAAH